MLRAGAAVLASGSEPDREAWHNYVSELDLDRTLPGIARLGYAAAVDDRAPVVFMEPMTETDRTRLGFDMYSEAVRRIALERARDSGDAVLSAPTSPDGSSDSDDEITTVLVYPVYRKGTTAATEAERREALLGWTYSPWQVTTLVNTILGDYRERWSDQFALQIYDGGEALPSTLLYSRERQLGESEARWKFVLDHTDEGIWEWDVSTETVNFSRRWKDLLGYGEHDLGTALAEWERRVHPDDLEAVKTAMRATLKGHNMSFEHEHRMLCKDGSWRRVRDSGLVVSRDREGRPLRVLGTLKDLGPT